MCVQCSCSRRFTSTNTIIMQQLMGEGKSFLPLLSLCGGVWCVCEPTSSRVGEKPIRREMVVNAAQTLTDPDLTDP